MTGAEITVSVLIEQGVDTIFGYPGGMVINIYDELYKYGDRIRHCLTCHEQGAAHAADGYARATGKVGVCLATSGPGATNLVTGIATAYLDSVPVVAITGNVPTPLIGRDSFQEIDIMGVTMPVTKHNYIVKDITRLASTLREAFEVAQSGRAGPVLVDIPKDIQLAEHAYLPEPARRGRQPKDADPDALQSARELIMSAEKPLIYAGGGVISAGAERELAAFAERIDAPVVASIMGLSAMPSDYHGFLGMVGMHGLAAANRALDACDLLIAVGSRFSDRATGNKTEFTRGKRILHFDIDPAEIGKNIEAYTGVVGDVGNILRNLDISPLCHEDWRREIEAIRGRPDPCPPERGGLRPRKVIETVRRFMPDDSLAATDVGQHQMWTAQYYALKHPRTLITSGGLGTMGFGMGAAIGASIGMGKRRTVLFTSDGSFHMNMNELATAVSNDIPLLVVVMNNNALGMVRQWQTIFFGGRYSQTTPGRVTDYVKLAESLGAHGRRVGTEAELEPALEYAMSLNTPVLLECVIDPDEKVLPMIPPGGGIKDIILR